MPEFDFEEVPGFRDPRRGSIPYRGGRVKKYYEGVWVRYRRSAAFGHFPTPRWKSVSGQVDGGISSCRWRVAVPETLYAAAFSFIFLIIMMERGAGGRRASRRATPVRQGFPIMQVARRLLGSSRVGGSNFMRQQQQRRLASSVRSKQEEVLHLHAFSNVLLWALLLHPAVALHHRDSRSVGVVLTLGGGWEIEP